MKCGYQSLCEIVGKWGCYALCLIHISEKTGAEIKDPVSAISAAMSAGLIDKDDCTVLDAPAFLRMLTGKKWDIARDAGGNYRVSPSYIAKNGDFIVKEYYNKTTGFSHFVCDDYDGLKNSMTVRFGELRSLRVFRMA